MQVLQLMLTCPQLEKRSLHCQQLTDQVTLDYRSEVTEETSSALQAAAGDKYTLYYSHRGDSQAAGPALSPPH